METSRTRERQPKSPQPEAPRARPLAAPTPRTFEAERDESTHEIELDAYDMPCTD